MSSVLVLSGSTFALAALPAHAVVDCSNGVGAGVALTDTSGGSTGAGACDDSTASTSFSTVIKNIINIFSIVVGAVSVIMIIVGGFRYIISNGDSNGVSGAKNTILYAIIGLVIVLFAQVIVRFVLTNVAK